MVFLFLKDFIFNEYHKFCVLFYTQFTVITYPSYNELYFDKKNQKNIYCHQYNYTNKSSYKGSIYIVKPGDTLFYIAWVTGNNYLDLAKNNNIKNIHVLKVNQILKIKNKTMHFLFLKKLFRKILFPFDHVHGKIKNFFVFNKKKKIVSDIYKYISCNINNIDNVYYENKTNVIISNDWYWPTSGSIINTFSETEGGNTGIDISGSFDQPILATTNGQVVYVGNVLKGYGNLVIIKHDNNYLSAYAHNNKILVSEKQYVKIGDQIATMGSTGTDEVKLHFEIRHKGKSVNPLYLLP